MSMSFNDAAELPPRPPTVLSRVRKFLSERDDIILSTLKENKAIVLLITIAVLSAVISIALVVIATAGGAALVPAAETSADHPNPPWTSNDNKNNSEVVKSEEGFHVRNTTDTTWKSRLVFAGKKTLLVGKIVLLAFGAWHVLRRLANIRNIDYDAPDSWREFAGNWDDHLLDLPKYPKHVMILTRGTRGDVQPFLALAKGLAETHNWRVTICTEAMFYESLIKHNAKGLKAGMIQFRPSGGNSDEIVEGVVAKFTLTRLKALFVQAFMLAGAEMAFFESAKPFMHWAETMKPDYLIFGMQTAAIASMVSEKLRIPVAGFILQSQIIPTSDSTRASVYGAPADRYPGDGIWASYGFHKWLKGQLEDRSIIGFPRTRTGLRKQFGLPKLRKGHTNTWKRMAEQNIPIALPMPEVAAGDKPSDWNTWTNLQFTDFISLRAKKQMLDAPLQYFIDAAKSDGSPLVVISFSSMPVEYELVCKIAVGIIEKTKGRQPRVVVVSVRKDDDALERANADLLQKMRSLMNENRLFVATRAPFDQLFAQMDAAILQGGLGTTSEAMRAGIPFLITGVLLMDQRFWGKRAYDLGVSPQFVHMSTFKEEAVFVANVQNMLHNATMNQKAKELSQRLRQLNEDDLDGVRRNSQFFVDALVTGDARVMEA